MSRPTRPAPSATLWLTALALVAGLGAAPGLVLADAPPAPEIAVDCDHGPGLQQAVEQRAPGGVRITFRGTCREDVSIHRDDVALRGAGESAVLAGALTVRATNRVELAGFSVEAGPDRTEPAVRILDSRSFVVSDLAVSGAGGRGVFVDGSEGSIEALSVRDAATDGLSISSSRVRVTGDVIATDNGAAGIDAHLGSDLTFDAARVRTDRNFLGFVVRDASIAAFSGGELTARDQDLAGIVVAVGAALTYGGTEVVATDNGRGGLLITERSSFIPAGFGARLEFLRNGFAGIIAQEGSSLSLSGVGGRTTVRENTCFGLLIDGSKALLLNSSVTDNDLQNARILFGSRVTSGPIELPLPIHCEDSVITRGVDVCAPARSAAGAVDGEAGREAPPTAREIAAPILEALAVSDVH